MSVRFEPQHPLPQYHECILVAWKINELRTAQISGYVVLPVFGGPGTLTVKGIPIPLAQIQCLTGMFIKRTVGGQLGRRGGNRLTPFEGKRPFFLG